MAMQVGKKFSWVIKDFPSLQCEICYSAPVLIETYHWFDEKNSCWGFPSMIPLTKLHDEKEGFLVNGYLVIVAEVDVLAVIATLDESEESEESRRPVKKSKHGGGGQRSTTSAVSCHLGKETMDVNGFQVLVSQVESVRRIFEMHPDIAVDFRAKNQHLRKACMSFLLSLIETLCMSLKDLSNEDLVEADVALMIFRIFNDAGFKVDWLEKKLEILKEKKEKEKCSLILLEEMKEKLLELKQKCSDLDALVEKEEAELLAIRTPSSFVDVL
ncbi:unnamed protein product [Brassica oleracea]